MLLTIVGDLYDTFQLPERLPFNFSNGQAFTRADGNLYIFTDSAKLIGLSSLTGKWFSNEMPIMPIEPSNDFCTVQVVNYKL